MANKTGVVVIGVAIGAPLIAIVLARRAKLELAATITDTDYLYERWTFDNRSGRVIRLGWYQKWVDGRPIRADFYPIPSSWKAWLHDWQPGESGEVYSWSLPVMHHFELAPGEHTLKVAVQDTEGKIYRSNRVRFEVL